MIDRFDSERIRDEHIRSEQRREEQKRVEASQKQHRKIEDGFRRLKATGRDVERLRGDIPVQQAAEAVAGCEAEIGHILEKLKGLPDDPGRVFPRFFIGSNADIRLKAEQWEELLRDFQLSLYTDVWAAVDRINRIRKEVDKYRFPPQPSEGNPFFNVTKSDDAINLLKNLSSRLLWLDQYYLDFDHAKQKKEDGIG